MRQMLRRAGGRGCNDSSKRWFRVIAVSFRMETKPTPDEPKRAMWKAVRVRKARISSAGGPYDFLMRRPQTRMAALRASMVKSSLKLSWRHRHGRSDFSGVGRRGVCRLRRSRCCAEAGVTMLVAILWGVGAVVVAVYMVAALLRPERF